MAFFKTSFFLFLLFCNGFMVGQEHKSDTIATSEFEVLTGKTSYQLMHYFLQKSDPDVSGIQKEMQLLSDKILAAGSTEAQAEWLYIKVRIYSYRFSAEAYRVSLDNYNLFIKNNYKEESYVAKQKLLEGYTHFYNGTWTKSLAAYQEALALARQVNDMFSIMDSRKQIAYISTFSGDQELALQQLKNVFYELDTDTNILGEIKKDIPLLKINTLELICRFYWLNRASEVDSLLKYNKFYKDRIKEVNDSLEYSRMYTYAAYTAVQKKQFDQAEKFIDSAKNIDMGFSRWSMINFVEAEIYYNQKRYKEGIALVENFGNADSLSPTRHSFLKYDFKYLAKSYKMINNFERSNYYYEHFERSNSSLDKIMDSVSLSIRKREVAAFKKELKALHSEKKSTDFLLKYLVFGGSLVILVLLLILFRFYKLKKRNEEQFIALVEGIEKQEVEDKGFDVLKNTEQSLSTKEINVLNEETVTTILQGLQKLEAQHYFLKQECSAYTIAKKIKTNTSYLSKVMNSHYKKTFNAYINDLRINYVLVRLRDDKRFRAYNIQSIAEELGYKSADSFTKYFRKHTGLLPSFYIKKLDAIDLD